MTIEASRGATAIGRVAALCAVLALLPACGLFTTPAQMLARADKNLAAHDYRAAAVDLRNLIAKQPNDRALHLKLAEALLHTGAYVEADANFRRAQQLGAPWLSIGADLAEALLGEGQPEQALGMLDAHPPAGNPGERTLSLRGRALLALGKRDEARQALDQALALDGADIAARVALATLLEAQGETAGAKSALETAASSAPSDFSPHLALGIWYTRQRQLRDAHDELTRALDLAVSGIRAGREPWFDEYRVLAPLAESDLMLGDIPSAERRVRRMRKLAPHASATLLLLARIDLAHRRTTDARLALQDLLSRDPQNEAAQVLLGDVDAAAGQLEQADMYLTAALAAAPGDRTARKLLAEVQLRERKPQEALRTATGADAALDGDLLALAAQASAQSGDLAGATAFLERSEKAASQDKVRALQLAAAYLAGHRAADALKLLRSQQVPASLAPRREWLLLMALSQTGAASDVRTEARRFAAAHPHDVTSLLVAAQGLALARDVNGAREILDEATRADPSSPRPWIALGVFEGALGRRQAAEAAFQRALQIDPRNLGALIGEARLFLSAGDPARATVPLAKARSIAPDDATVALLTGAVALAQGRGPDAVGDFRRLSARFPRSAVLQTDLARALVLARRPVDARRAAAQAVKLDPEYWPALVIDIALAVEARDLGAAQQLLPQLRATKAPSSIVLTVEGNVAARQGHSAEALRDYSAAASVAPSAALALEMASLRHALHLADPDAPLTGWLTREPHDDEVRLVLAESLQQSADRTAAAKQYEAVLADQPKQLIALNNLAWLRLEEGHADAALALARQAYAIAPMNASVEDTFGWALVQSGNATDALSILRTAHRGAPTDPQIHLHWATALLETGAKQDARRELQAIVEAQPDGPDGAKARQLLAGLSGTASR